MPCYFKVGGYILQASYNTDLFKLVQIEFLGCKVQRQMRVEVERVKLVDAQI